MVFDEQFSAFDYQYRDAGNYKAPGLLLLHGAYDAAFDNAIRECCDGWEYFVAEQVGVPSLYAGLYMYSHGPTSDDIAFHEFRALRPAAAHEIKSMLPWGSLNDLIARFRAVRIWDGTMSPHC